MRKRSSYRPREKLKDTMAWVKSGFHPVTTAHDVIQTVRILNHGAIEAVRKGEATWEDVCSLVVAFKVAEALAVNGIGHECLPQIKAALAVAQGFEGRERWLLRGGELPTINLGMDIHDAQLDICSVNEMVSAMAPVKKFIEDRRRKAKVPA